MRISHPLQTVTEAGHSQVGAAAEGRPLSTECRNDDTALGDLFIQNALLNDC